ncbi:MAG: ABC transporter permease [Candidatus Rokubacteria bacterium 13_1_40CM_69_27]|nr:MAG: ABC transporter permease [Candidatus Rokubacteria bacterium 13_1_40CM_69_27]OLC33501.1 MAG: ABC transporter permease [Candidatus Rokubacteria bacterium 13_1_40CM_4_69_5]
MAPGWKRAFFGLAVTGVTLLLVLPVAWMVLTAIRPASGVFYVHRGTEFTLGNFAEALAKPEMKEAFVNSALIATLATVFSLAVTITSGYMLSRFSGAASNLWFGLIYLFRCIPYISWVIPLYLLTQWMGILDTYLGLLLPHIAIHICFFSWIMKGFFDGIEPEAEYAAYIDGCSRWGAFIRIALPMATPGIVALFILSWLYTWNEFLFALILTGSRTTMLTVRMAQFVHETGIEWHLMSATAVMAIGPALIVTLFAQEYVVKGLKI